MKNNHELKQLAKNSMNGYTSTLVLSYIIYMVIPKIAAFVPGGMFFIGILIPAIIVGLYSQAFNLTIGNDITIKDLFTDFHTMLKAILVQLLIGLIITPLIFALLLIAFIVEDSHIILLTTLGLGLVLISIVIWYIGIIASQVYFIILDDKDLSVIDIIKRSIALTKNNKLRIVLLELSFIPLYILCGICLGIPYLWVMPYYVVTKAYLYHDLKENYCANITY